VQARPICTTMGGGGGYWDGGRDGGGYGFGRLGRMMMETRVRTAIATTAVGGRPHHLDVNDADADDLHPDSGMARILTQTPTR
jgi:hypothetical protein